MNNIQGVIQLFGQIRYLQTRTWFEIVQNQRSNFLDGTKNIKVCFQGTFFLERKEVCEHTTPVSIFGRGAEDNANAKMLREGPVDEQDKYATNRFAKLITIPAKS